MVVIAPTTQATLTGLNHSTLYLISVSASTIKGNGYSSQIHIATGSNSEVSFFLLDFNREKKITTIKKGKEKGGERMAML